MAHVFRVSMMAANAAGMYRAIASYLAHQKGLPSSLSRMRTGGAFPFVGFFGQKRAYADTGLLDALDAALIQELHNYPQMLSYSSLELSDGSWGNLVVMSSPDSAVHWAGSARHAYAAYTVAPACYTTIRLHSGVMTLNGAMEGALHILRTKHFDYAWGNC